MYSDQTCIPISDIRMKTNLRQFSISLLVYCTFRFSNFHRDDVLVQIDTTTRKISFVVRSPNNPEGPPISSIDVQDAIHREFTSEILKLKFIISRIPTENAINVVLYNFQAPQVCCLIYKHNPLSILPRVRIIKNYLHESSSIYIELPIYSWTMHFSIF